MGKELTMNIGDRAFEIPEELSSLLDAIKKSEYIICLPPGWDEENAKQIPYLMWSKVMSFLLTQALYVFKHYNRVMDAPEITPVANGSINISWMTLNEKVRVNIRYENCRALHKEKKRFRYKNEETLTFYWGDDCNDKFTINDSNAIDSVSTSLLQWIKVHLVSQYVPKKRTSWWQITSCKK